MTRLLPGKKELEKGQAVLVVLLVMSVLLTLGLSVVSRSVTDVKISQQSQESARAFWTAQAGLEKALLAQGEIPLSTVDGVSYAVTKSALGGDSGLVFPEKISSGESVVYWLVDHDSNGEIGGDYYSGDSLIIYWGNESEGANSETTPALIASLVYKDSDNNYYSRKYTFDPYSGRGTNFGSPDSGTDFDFRDNVFAFKATIPDLKDLPSYDKPIFLNTKIIFNNTPQILGVRTETGVPGPIQGSCYESKATVTVSNIVRNLSECRTWPQTPEIFDYLLFSGGNI